MRYLDILLEFDLQKTIQNYSEKLLDRIKSDHSAKNKSIEEIINLFMSNDPTSKKAYVLWMINSYLSNGIRFLEDLGRTNEALTAYIDLKFKNKLKIEHKDINKIKSLNELESLIDEYNEKPIIPQSERQREKELEDQFFKNKEAILFYNDNEIKVVIPKTERASCFFGRNTKWCTAATNNNMFSSYNKEGTLYIVLIKKENKRYQFYFESNQFMDEKDQQIMNWNEIISKYPKLIDIFNNLGRKYLFIPLIKNPDKDVQLAAVTQDGRAIRYIENPDKDVQLAAVKHDGYAIKFIKNPDKDVQLAAVKHDGYAIKFIENPDKEVQLAAMNRNVYGLRGRLRY